MNRRGFIGSIIATCVAPAIVRAEILMPVRKIWTPYESLAAQISARHLSLLERNLDLAWNERYQWPESAAAAIRIRRLAPFKINRIK